MLDDEGGFPGSTVISLIVGLALGVCVGVLFDWWPW